MTTIQSTPPAPIPPPYYPVHLRADVQPHASRWLWLVKWLLLVPHAVVLLFLWLAFVALSLVAFVGILVTGRYPRALFDFNVGVLRWSWRVVYYGYSALATDQYPPFTLADVPDYPAHLEIDYPEHLSRGLVLVKWWLLALPHYLVVGILVGGGSWWVANDQAPDRFTWGGGLVGLLVLVAAVVLALTGQYPRGVYDLVLGLNRWVLRVCAYAALMTDAYPPFRLDLGPGDPSDRLLPTDSAPPPPQPASAVSAVRAGSPVSPASPMSPGAATRPAGPGPVRRSGWTGGRITSVVAGSLLGLISLGVLTGGAALLVIDHAMRDGTGFVTSSARSVNSSGYAVAVTSMVIETSPGDSTLPSRALGDVRLRVSPTGPGAVFVGIGPTSAVQRYLAGVARTVPAAGWADGRDIAGHAPSQPPTALSIWNASAVGTGPQTLTWTPRSGDWAVVLMNADGSAGVNADVDVGARLPWLGAVGVVGLVAGLVLLVGGVTLVAVATRRASARPPAPSDV
ncbi:DUF4389 domain-containing protein [Pedococcus sp. KACC 23699]|uniref:DUF4389 domain-containing protein n=1 Tax=Pedococcus sp. KACC 23699 TaxID=3149228 RepID=A0AAU7JT77_9MICO